jgi:hypothetical protein
MGVREKMKKAFGGRKSGGNSPSDAGTPKIPGVEYYKPGQVPKSKYRGKWDQDHQDKLHAFSFAAAFKSRRGSGHSIYSPSGRKAQSRRASSFSKQSRSDVDGTSLRRKSTNPGRVLQGVDDQGDVANGQCPFYQTTVQSWLTELQLAFQGPGQQRTKSQMVKPKAKGL